MKVTITSSRLVKPSYQGKPPPRTTDYVPLNVFDKANFNSHQGFIFAYKCPTPSNSNLESGLQKALSLFRAFAGRLGTNQRDEPVVLLNDKGARFVEAFVDGNLVDVIPSQPSTSLLALHPSTDTKDVEELMQVQITRFTCGSMVVGYTDHQLVVDGQSGSNFLVAWCQACQGEEIHPLPLNDPMIFSPRDPPRYEFDHKNIEFMSEKIKEENSTSPQRSIVVHKAHFTTDFLDILKSKACTSLINSNDKKPYYSTLVCLVAHLWKVITKARSLPSTQTTHVRIAVNGRRRLNPKVPDEYFGNVLLWAFPAANVEDFVDKPLSVAADMVHGAISKVNKNYFRSFIDFASYKVEEEKLIPTADADELVLSPNLEVDSCLSFQFHKLDFGGGKPFLVMPSYLPIEGLIYLLPSLSPSGGIDAFVSLFKDNIALFDKNCYSVESCDNSSPKLLWSNI